MRMPFGRQVRYEVLVKHGQASMRRNVASNLSAPSLTGACASG
jgi:hypothetical protein